MRNNDPCILITLDGNLLALATDNDNKTTTIRSINKSFSLTVNRSLSDHKFKYCAIPEFYAC